MISLKKSFILAFAALIIFSPLYSMLPNSIPTNDEELPLLDSPAYWKFMNAIEEDNIFNARALLIRTPLLREAVAHQPHILADAIEKEGFAVAHMMITEFKANKHSLSREHRRAYAQYLKDIALFTKKQERELQRKEAHQEERDLFTYETHFQRHSQYLSAEEQEAKNRPTAAMFVLPEYQKRPQKSCGNCVIS